MNPLFQAYLSLLIAIHHASNARRQVSGNFSPGFNRKIKDLDQFLTPAFPDKVISTKLQVINRRWALEINKALNQHYTNKVDHLQGQIDGLQNSDLKAHTTSSNLALKKHRLTTKFSLDTVTQFKTISEARLTKNDSQLPHSTKTQPTHVNELNWQSPKNVSRPLLKDLTFNLDISNPFEILTLQASTSHEDPQIMNPAKKPRAPSLSPKPQRPKKRRRTHANSTTTELTPSTTSTTREDSITQLDEPIPTKTIFTTPTHDDTITKEIPQMSTGSNQITPIEIEQEPQSKTDPLHDYDFTTQIHQTSNYQKKPLTPNFNHTDHHDYTPNDLTLQHHSDSNNTSLSSSISLTPRRTYQDIMLTQTKTPETSDDEGTLSESVNMHRQLELFKNQWTIPEHKYPTLVIGDSNISRITRSKNTKMGFFAFENAKFCNIIKALQTTKTNHKTKKIIISLGTNNVDCKPDTNKDQIKRLATSLRQTYPQATLLAAPISIDKRLPKTVKKHLKDINTSFYNSRQFESHWSPPPTMLHPKLHEFLDDFKQILNIKPTTQQVAPPNLTPEEHRAFKFLQSTNEIVIKPADKGGATVILNSHSYIFEAYKQLLNPKYYRKIPNSMVPETAELISNILHSLHQENSLIKNNLTTSYPRLTGEHANYISYPKFTRTFPNGPLKPSPQVDP